MPIWTFYKRPNPLDESGGWQHLEPGGVSEQVNWLVEHLESFSSDQPIARASAIHLSHLAGSQLTELVPDDTDPVPIYLLSHQKNHYYLDGSVNPIFDLINESSITLVKDDIPEYLQFFFSHVEYAPGARLIPVNSLSQFRWRRHLSDYDRQQIEQYLEPVTFIDTDQSTNAWEVELTAISWDRLEKIRLRVDNRGKVAFRDFDVLMSSLPVAKEPLEDYVKEPFLFGPESGWSPVDADKLDSLKKLFSPNADSVPETPFVWQTLSFFSGMRLVRSEYPEHRRGFGVYALFGGDGGFILDGSSPPIHAARAVSDLRLKEDQAIEFMIFFCMFVHSGSGPFRIIFSPSDLNVIRVPDGTGDPNTYDSITPTQLGKLIKPPELANPGSGPPYIVKANLQYGSDLFRAEFAVREEGIVEMQDDQMLLNELPADPFIYTIPVGKGERKFSSIHPEPLIVQTIVEQQLIHALRGTDLEPIFSIDQGWDDNELLKQFGNFVFSHYPAIILVSNMLYCEEQVGDILIQHTGWNGRVNRVSPGSHGSAEVIPTFDENTMLQLSLHALPQLVKPEWIAYSLGVTEIPSLIGTPSLHVVPGPIDRITDLILPLREMDPTLFQTVFCKIFHCDWPDGLDISDEAWPRYIQPSDFHTSLRHRLWSIEKEDQQQDIAYRWSVRIAVEQIRHRVLSRLLDTDPGPGPRIEEIPGMGEAHVHAADMVKDIQDALSGKIKWSQVDRGLLLTGPPGTGKTWLAKAMARECGLRFIATSGGDWVSGTEHLGQHIQRIHQIFADARHYSPSIIFIDELDTIGSREKFSGRNQQYGIEIVNTLLQELDGFNQQEPVFVIGATNHIDQIDPAIRRSGRLDHTITIPLPNRDAIVQMFDYHLHQHRERGNLGSELDLYYVAGLCIGASGADIERFVRDGMRRARKDKKRLDTKHLVAAIIGRPHTDHSATLLSSSELDRVAVHETGHTLALLLCHEFKAEIGIVSVIPTPGDGNLGVTRIIPEPACALTRKGYIEYLQLLLAGRAAEALIFGEEEVSSGAGGGSESSDLAQATRAALHMITMLGMGSDQRLIWTNNSSPDKYHEEVEQILQSAYQAIYDLLQSNIELLNAVRLYLVEEQELLPDTLLAMVKEHGLQDGDNARVKE